MGVYVAKYRSRPVIQSPGVVELDLQRRKQILHFAGQRRITGSGILNLKEFAGKSAEIVNWMSPWPYVMLRLIVPGRHPLLSSMKRKVLPVRRPT